MSRNISISQIADALERQAKASEVNREYLKLLAEELRGHDGD